MTILLLAARQALEALETIGTMHGEWNNGMHAANAALKVLPALRTAIAEAEKQKPVMYGIRFSNGAIRGYTFRSKAEAERSAIASLQPNEVIPLYLTPQPAPKQEPSYRSVPHGHCTHPKCKEIFQEYLVLSEKIAKYEPEGKSPMILNAVPRQEPVAYLVYAKGSHKYMTLTFDTDKVPEIYKGGDVVALCAAGAQAKQVLENLDELSVGDSLFESWFSEYRPAHKGTKQQMRDAYAAGMGDPLVAPPQAQSDHVAGDGNMVQPLTFDQIEDIWTKHGLNECDCHGFARAIEQAHGIKEQS